MEINKTQNHIPNSDSESEDEVVAEFDICLAGSLKDQLKLLQYPLRPVSRPYSDQGDLVRAQLGIDSRYAPQTPDSKEPNQRVIREEGGLKLIYELNESRNYDANATHRIKEHTLLTSMVDTNATTTDSTFTSIEVACQANYAIGVFKDDRLLLTPLKSFH